VDELVEEAGLADADVAHDGDDLPLPAARLVERVPDLLDLGVASHEAREAPRARRLQARAGRGGGHQLEGEDRLGQALDRHRPERPHLHEALREPQRLGRQAGGPGRRELLHPGGEVRGLPHRGVVHVQVAADGAHDHVARVEADADLDLDADGPARLLGVAPDRVVHPQRGIARPHRVILVGERRPEQGHDPVAHDLVDGTLVPVHRLHHPLEHGVEDASRLLGIAVGEQLHRALEVGEEHGHLLALTLQRRARGEDALRQVARRVGVGRREARLAGGGADGRPALVAEARAVGQGVPAGAARQPETGAASEAEARRGRILLLAPGALHRGDLLSTWGDGAQSERSRRPARGQAGAVASDHSWERCAVSSGPRAPGRGPWPGSSP
jgi:hypothetical protein